MRPAAIVFASLCFIQLLGVCGSVIAAAIEIETIMVTGPIFSVAGVVVACGWKVSRNPLIVVFGLSAAVVSTFTFFLIFSLSWSPEDAAFPVPLMLLGYEFVIVPIGLFSIYRLLIIPQKNTVERTRQFDLRSLLIVTFVAAVGSAAGKFASDLGSWVLLAIAIGFCAATVIATVVVGIQISRHYFDA